MPERRFAIIDPAAGMSGDMLLGALVDAGLGEAWAQELPARLGLPDVTVGVSRVDRSGLSCAKVDVSVSGRTEAPAPAHADSGEAAHGHQAPEGGGHHQHRHLPDLLRRIEAADVSPRVREQAAAAYRMLAEAEGRVHGRPAERVGLHEVGALDALVDIVGAFDGFERLGVDRVHVLPVALGSGWVRAAHGTMPVPTPATALLAEGLEVGPNGPVRGEALTPTGAVLLRALSAGPPPDGWRAVATGWGAGGRNPEGYPNALRLLVVEATGKAERLEVVATDLDDMSPEYLPPLVEALMQAGAVDVQHWAVGMKKGRTGFRVEALVPPGRRAAVIEACFRHSTTAGVRWWHVERAALEREMVEVEVEGERVRGKVVHAPDGPRAKPEFDDVVAAAARLGRSPRDVAREAANRLAARLDAQRAGRPPAAT